jgi:hypothetical protein
MKKKRFFKKICKRLYLQGSNQGPSGYWKEALDHWATRDIVGKTIESCNFK